MSHEHRKGPQSSWIRCDTVVLVGCTELCILVSSDRRFVWIGEDARDLMHDEMEILSGGWGVLGAVDITMD